MAEQVPAYLWAVGSTSTMGAAVVNGVATDTLGNAYVAGSFSGVVSLGSLLLTNSSGPLGSMLFVAKLDGAGQVQWVRQGSSTNVGPATGTGVAVDGEGNVYLVGDYSGSLELGGATNTGSGFGSDVLTAKLDRNGNLLWLKTGGGPNDDAAGGIALDAQGNVLIAGRFGQGAVFGNVTLTNTLPGYAGVFLVKYDAQGNVIWARNGGGPNGNSVVGLTVDAQDNIALSGSFEMGITFGGILLTNTQPMSTQVYIAKYDSAGNVVWAKQAGGQSIDEPRAIAGDMEGNVLVTGYYGNEAAFGGILLTNQGGPSRPEVFVVKYGPDGSVLWVRQGGSPEWDEGTGISVDAAGNVYVSGHHGGTEFSPAIFGTMTLASGGAWATNSGFVAKYDTAGNLQWVRAAGGNLMSLPKPQGNRIVADASGRSYVAGGFLGSATFGTLTVTNEFPMSPQLFIARLDAGAPAAGPKLEIVRFGEKVILSWPQNAVGFNLHSTRSLTSPEFWEEIPIVPAPMSDLWVVTNDITGGLQIYRLRKTQP